MVDPTGLKPAPPGLKGRCSVTRAPDQEIGCGGRIRTFDSRINNAVPYQLGYATIKLEARGGVEPRAFRPALEGRFRRPMPGTRAAVGGDGEIRTHTMLFTRQLLYQLELHRLTDWGTGREADAPLRTPRSRDSLRSARMSHAPITCE